MKMFSVALLASSALICSAEAADSGANTIPGVYAGADVERLATDLQFVEGPVWIARGGYLLFSDIPANIIYKWSQASGLELWRKPSDNSNGLTLDRRGNLLACEHGSRTVTWSKPGGARVTLTSRCEGKRLSSPNDLAVKSDGTVYFTDPPYGLPNGRGREIDQDGVYRFDPNSWQTTRVAAGNEKPNGIAFSPDEKTLYVAYSDDKKPVVRAFDVARDGKLSNERVFCDCANDRRRVPDGIKVDTEGRLYVTCDGVMVFSPTGKHLGNIPVPEVPANCAWGGKDWKTLYITAQKSLYRVKLLTAGIPVGPKR